MNARSTIKSNNGEVWNTLKVYPNESVKMVNGRNPKDRQYAIFALTTSGGVHYYMGKGPGATLFETGGGFMEVDGKPSDILVLYAKPVKNVKGLETVAVIINPHNNDVTIHKDNIKVQSVEIIYN